MDADVGGKIQGISLDSFLQMAQMERTTCTLNVSAGDELGFLYLLNGELIDAQTGILEGSEAATLIISWDNASIEIENKCDKTENKIKQPLMNVLMEGMRIRDENKKGKPSAGPPGDPGHKEVSGPSPPPKKPAAEAAEEFASKDLSRPAEKIDSRTTPSEPDAKPAASKPAEQKINVSTVPAKKFPLPAAIAGAGVLIVVAIAIYMVFLKSDDYQKLLARVDSLQRLEEKIKLLEEYKKSQGKKADETDLEQKIRNLRNQIEDRDFKAVNKQVASLSMDKDFEQKAVSIYNQYLEKYPKGILSSKVKKLISDIPFRKDDNAFQRLKATKEGDYVARILAYRSYLADFPDGRHRETVTQMISELAEVFYFYLKSKTASCDHQQQWDTCIDLCEKFIANFENHPRLSDVISLQKQLQGKEDWAGLNKKITTAGENYTISKQYLSAYLQENPDSEITEKVKKLLKTVNQKIVAQGKWKNLVGASQNQQVDVFTRIRNLQEYIDKNPASENLDLAKNLMKQLQEEKTLALKQREMQDAEKRRQAKIQEEKIRSQQEMARLQRIRKQVIAQIQQTGGRFIVHDNDGTFTDTKTGKMWCILDSQLERGECMNYEAASNYVKTLRTGGYDNWRMPTPGELAGIYKNKPFFPKSGAAWYWTSETFIKGYHKIASVVTTKHEMSFKKEQLKQERCGAVRAIRP